jgi:hypothetical protein
MMEWKQISRGVLPLALVLVLAFAGVRAALTAPPRRKKAPPLVRVVPLPTLRLPRQPPATPAETTRIKALIAMLAEIDRPDFGLSPSMSGAAFAPVPGSERAGAFVLGNHGLKRSGALAELVKLGPRALPFLLTALDDKTPTRLTMKLGEILEWMQFATEADGNPANAREQKALAALPRPKEGANFAGDRHSSHPVTIGDVCFVILGQITGRDYEAARYQPTGGIFINSPTESPLLARAMRAVWSGSDPAPRLLESLLLDYRTRGVHDGKSFDHWDIGARFQPGAAMRLLY